MERIRLSKNLIYGLYICIAASCMLAYIIYLSSGDLANMIGPVIFLLISFALSYFFSKAKTVEFDANFIYISKGQNTESIALSSISKIQLSPLKINRQNMWKIKFTDALGKEDSVGLLPKQAPFEIFKGIVLKKNPDVQIQNWSDTLDFDI